MDVLMADWMRDRTDYDIVLGRTSAYFAPAIRAGKIASLESLFNIIPKDEWVWPYVKPELVEGEPFSASVCGEVITLIYRVDYLRDAGFVDTEGNVVPPKTWEEVAEYAKKLTRDTDGDGQTDIYGLASPLFPGRNKILWNVWAGGVARGAPFLDDKGLYNITDPRMVESLKFFADLRKAGAFLPDAHTGDNVARNAFKAGKVAMLITWHSRLIEAQEVFGYEKADLVMLPGAKKNGSYTVAGAGWVIPKAGNVDLAKHFLVELGLSKYFQQWSAKKYGKAPTLKRNYEGLGEKAWYWDELVKVASKSAYPPFDPDNPEIWDALSLEMEKALLGRKSPEEAMNDAYDKMLEIKGIR